jgi:hypothetical protein
MKKLKELTERQDKRISFILEHTKSTRIRKKALKRLMDCSFGGKFTKYTRTYKHKVWI